MEACPKEVAWTILSFVCGGSAGESLGYFREEAMAVRSANRWLAETVSGGFAWLAVRTPGKVPRFFSKLRVVHVAVGTPVVDRDDDVFLREHPDYELSLRVSPWLKPANPLSHPLSLDRRGETFLRLCALDVSNAEQLDDPALSATLATCPNLRELRATDCPNIVEPKFQNKALRVLDVDGSYRLKNLRDLPHVDVDIFASSFRKDDVVDVVVLSGRHRGRWVACSVLEVVGLDDDATYDVLVHPTHDCDRAVGFAGRCARNIKRRHLRVPRPPLQGGDDTPPSRVVVRPLVDAPVRPRPKTFLEWAREADTSDVNAVAALKERYRSPDQRTHHPRLQLWPPAGANLAIDLAPTSPTPPLSS
mmetsp:Transcript_19594/g.62968  ORF Transcript_19594/g.62968 Transcript_19594/m.62968 type:complete len:362 (+) Transcript_19594:69-1154(+)